MANNLDILLHDKYVVLHKRRYPKVPEIQDRVFFCKSGFGCDPDTAGNAVYGQFISDSEVCRVDGTDIERLASSEEIKQAYINRVRYLARAKPIKHVKDLTNTCSRCGFDYTDKNLIVIDNVASLAVCQNCIHIEEAERLKDKAQDPTECKEYYAEKGECMKMTRILQEHGAIGFHATMKDQKRNCCGIKTACYFTT